MRIIATAALLAMSLPMLLCAGIGEITFIEGTVEIARNGGVIDEMDLDVGSEIDNFDQIRTGDDGQLFILIESDRSPETEIHISQNTVFTIELNRIESKETTTLQLITGSLALKIGKLSGNQRFNVTTEAAAMGVRGTSFLVQTSPASDVLVACEEGRVSCVDEDSGRAVDAQPGQIVEKRSGDLFRAVPVAVSDLATFRREWLTERIEAFKPNALKVLRLYAVRYDELSKRFYSEYEALMARSAVLDKWIQEDREGTIGSRIELMREKKQIVGHLFRIRGILFIFERIYFRLLELYSYFEQGYGQGQIHSGLSAAEFFESFNAQRADLHEKIVRVRYVMKLYALRNEGVFPLSRF